MGSETYNCVSTVPVSDDDNDLDGSSRPSFLEVWLKTVPLVLLAFSTVTFNLMVLWMFKVKRSLRSCKNMYLASLALADLIIGLCMFLAVVQQVRRQVEWLPVFWCRLYLVLRQSALYVSLLSLVLITIDRWWSIHYPFSYRARRRTKNALLAVGMVWLFGFALHILPVALWDYVVGPHGHGNSSADHDCVPSNHHNTSCDLPFSESLLFVSIVSAVQYFVPLMAMLSLNCSLYLGILQRKRIQIRRSVTSSDKLAFYDRRTSISSIPDTNTFSGETMQLLHGNGLKPPSPTRINNMRRNSADVVLLRSYRSAPQFTNMLHTPLNPAGRRFSWAPLRKTSIRPSKDGEELAKDLLVKQDRKAAFWLGLLVIVFLVCWLPYSIVGILQSATYCSIPQWAKDITFWFLLANSAINPLLYGLFNREMWRAFKHWFCGTNNRQWRAKNALLFYGAAVTIPVSRRISSFDTVPE